MRRQDLQSRHVNKKFGYRRRGMVDLLYSWLVDASSTCAKIIYKGIVDQSRGSTFLWFFNFWAYGKKTIDTVAITSRIRMNSSKMDKYMSKWMNILAKKFEFLATKFGISKNSFTFGLLAANILPIKGLIWIIYGKIDKEGICANTCGLFYVQAKDWDTQKWICN